MIVDVMLKLLPKVILKLNFGSLRSLIFYTVIFCATRYQGFFKNGERLGEAFTNVLGDLRPCVDLFDYGDTVRMLKAAHPF